MTMRPWTSLAILAGLLALQIAKPTHAASVTLTRIGNPIWEPVDFQLFSALIGEGPDYPEFSQTTALLLPEPNHRPHPDLGIGPGVAHPGPYTSELAMGVAHNGFVDKDAFSVAEYTNGKAVFFIFMVVPSPGTIGSSPDFTSGPIIPNSLFPMPIHFDNFRNGVFLDEVVNFQARPLDNALNPPFDVQGHSHFPVFTTDNLDFAPPGTDPVGNYEYRGTMRDSAGNGYDLSVTFSVVPEPSSIVLASISTVGLWAAFGVGARWKKRGTCN